MRTHDYLKARLRYVRQDFDEVLEQLERRGPALAPSGGHAVDGKSPH